MKKFKNYNLEGTSFVPCITDSAWRVSRWDVTHANTNRRAIYIFGADGASVTLYNRNNPNFRLADLVYDTLTNHLEKDQDDFKTGLFRFEFDGQSFNYCEEEPKWAKYDCGALED